MNLKDFQQAAVPYDWKTIYLGVQGDYLNKDVISEYAVELIATGDDSDFVLELVWDISNEEVGEVMREIKRNYLPELDPVSKECIEEIRKLSYMSLVKMKANAKDNHSLLKEIAAFYADHHYPEDMVHFIHYMPQDEPTTEEELINRFNAFLRESNS